MLKGRVAIVTGSTSGIGLGIAMELVGQGAEIVSVTLAKWRQSTASRQAPELTEPSGRANRRPVQ